MISWEILKFPWRPSRAYYSLKSSETIFCVPRGIIFECFNFLFVFCFQSNPFFYTQKNSQGVSKRADPGLGSAVHDTPTPGKTNASSWSVAGGVVGVCLAVVGVALVAIFVVKRRRQGIPLLQNNTHVSYTQI